VTDVRLLTRAVPWARVVSAADTAPVAPAFYADSGFSTLSARRT
jgi:hypothetical protein